MHEKHKKKYYLYREDKASIAFFPLGLIGLLLILVPLIYGFFIFAKYTIQKDIQSNVESELSRQHLSWVNVDVSGQNVFLSGDGSNDQGQKAILYAKQVVGSTWLGDLKSPIYVTGEFKQTITDAPKKNDSIKPVDSDSTDSVIKKQTNNGHSVLKTKESQSLPEPKPIWSRLISTLKPDSFVMGGYVSSQSEKNDLITFAKKQLLPLKITNFVDRLTVVNDVPLIKSPMILKTGLSALALCRYGKSSFIHGELSLECEADQDRLASIRSILNRPLENGKLGDIRLSAAADCNMKFSNAMKEGTINFAVSSAVLAESSFDILDKVAGLVRVCPGVIHVEGHTDDSGDFDLNMALSNARAQSVMQALIERGVSKDQLVSKGYGSTRPIADNVSAKARSLNRRIEFRILSAKENP